MGDASLSYEVKEYASFRNFFGSFASPATCSEETLYRAHNVLKI